MSILISVLTILISSVICNLLFVVPSSGLSGLHLPQWMGLTVIGLLFSWLIGE